MLENRRHHRFREVIDIRWAILGTDLNGEGKLLNISASGFLLQTDARFDPKHSGLLFIDSQDEQPLAFGSKKGKIIWLKRMPESRPGFLCGVEFLRNTPSDRALNDWINKKTDEMAQASDAKILVNYIA